MKTLLIAASVLALSSPALAQTTGTAGTTPGSSSSTTTTTGSSAADMAPVAPSAPQAAPQPAAQPAAASDPKQIIATEFPTYDKDSNGALSTVEFDTWMVALKEKSGAPAMKPAESSAWLKGAFTSADKDKSKSVSLTELTSYLTAAS